MTVDRGSDPQTPHDEVLSKVDALLRRHRSGGVDLVVDPATESEIPTLTELIEEPPAAAADSARAASPDVPALETEALPEPSDPAPVAVLHAAVERIVFATLEVRLPQAIQEQVMPAVTRELGQGLNRLQDIIRPTVESVVQETIEREVKRVLKSLLKERTDR